MEPQLLLSLLLLSAAATATNVASTAISLPPAPSPTASTAELDPKQLQALQSLNIPTARDPCSSRAAVCDGATPYRRLISLTLANCSGDATLSITSLRALSTLTSLHFLNCPVTTVRLPEELAGNLSSFSAASSLRRLSSVWLSRLRNLTDLTVSSVPVAASGPYVIVGNMRSLTSVTVSAANLTGSVPRRLNPNTTHIDFSRNKLRGKIPISITRLERLDHLDLSENDLAGAIPEDVGNLVSLRSLNLSGNSMSGAIPESLSAIPALTHLDLGSNDLNGSIPKFVSRLKTLKTLNLENNNFHGVLPFNSTFIKNLEVFKVGGNENLCYNHSVLSSRLKLGIAKCDKHGLPLSPPPEKDSADDSSVDDSNDDGGEKGDKGRGPSKVVLGVAIGLSSIVFLIIFLVLLSKCCG